MAVGRRLNAYSGMRFDIPHLRSIESATSYDFDSLMRGLFTGLNQPYLIRGFKLVIPQATTEAQNLQIEVADSAVLHSSASESGTILLTAPGLPAEYLSSGANPKVIGSFLPNAVNYVSLDYRRVTDSSTVDQTAGWSPSQQLEFQRSIAIGKVLEYRFVITTSGFSTNLPLYTIKINSSNNFEWATKAVPSLFRLGSGGATPNPQNNFAWGNYTNNQESGTINPRREWVNTNKSLNEGNPLTVGTLDNSNAFNFGDFAITNMKEWMDAVMSRFKEIDGSDYWYVNSRFTGKSPNAFNTWWDAAGSLMTGAGSISYNLVLESSHPTSGRFQQMSTDSTIRAGDLYIEGMTSGTKANVVSFNNDQLLINSMTASDFSHGTGAEGEVLRARRYFQPLLDRWVLDDFNFSTVKYASLRRKTIDPSGSAFNISSWLLETKATSTDFLYSLLTATTSDPHTFIPGDYVHISGAGSLPDGVYQVLDVSKIGGDVKKFTFATGIYLSLTPTNGAAQKDSSVRNPYAPEFEIHSYSPFSLSPSETKVKLLVDDHNCVGEQQLSASFSSSSKTVTFSNSEDYAKIKVGMRLVNTNIPSTAVIVKINGTTNFEISDTPTATSTESVKFYELISVSGVSSTGYGVDVLTGIFPVDSITIEKEIVIDIGTTPPSAVTLTNSFIQPIVFQSTTTVTDAVSDLYNVENIQSVVVGGTDLVYPVGPSTLPDLDPASGSITFDGVIAYSKILNPVKVNSIYYYLASGLDPKRVVVNTAVPHGIENGNHKNITIYGSQSLSVLIRSYKDVNVISLSSTSYQIAGGEVETDFEDSVASNPFINSGTDSVYSRFDSNPYAGPVAWTSDMIVHGIIGDLNFKIPQTATVDTTDPDNSIVANNFNVDGLTGTAYLQDGEVLYVKLKRNIIAGNGAIFSTLGGNSTIITSSYITDENGDPLEVGDWIKWQDEDERKWLKIKTISNSNFTLQLENGQTPSIQQRPAKSGKIVYCKGSYPKLYVKKHILVDSSSDIYWIAVRKDGDSGQSKVYFRGLELQKGEVRQISDTVNSNLLEYVGAPSQGATNPNYSTILGGDYAATKENVLVTQIDVPTRMVTFSSDTAPERGFQIKDLFYSSSLVYYTVKQVISSRTVIVEEDVSGLSGNVTYLRVNKFIQDQDNLTAALRKEDRQAGHVETALLKPVYDEMVYIQRMDTSGSGNIKSGEYVYQGPDSNINNATALAWVLHGNAQIPYTVEGAIVQAPGGEIDGTNSVLVHVYSGTFTNGGTLYQIGSATGRTFSGTLTAPSVAGDSTPENPTYDGVEMILPPNRRTKIAGVVWGNHSYYKQSSEADLTGEDLLVIVNDGIRHAGVDYVETFGGPRAKIRLIRTLPPNSRMRFRVQSTMGSAIVAKSADVSLQAAYTVGSTISTSLGRPVEITSSNVTGGETAQILRGSLKINGGASAAGGIFNESGDQKFVIGNETNKPKESWTGLDAVKTHLTHPNSAWKRGTSAQTVTGDSATVITDSAIQMAEGQAYRIRMNAVARRSDGTLGVSSLVLEGTFYMTGGTVYAAGSPITTINGYAGDGYNYASAFGIQGTAVVLVVYGTAGATIQWAVGQDWQAVGNS